MSDCPKTIAEAVDIILYNLSDADVDRIRAASRPSMLNLTLGAQVRASWIHHQECMELYEDIWKTHDHLGGWLEDDDDYIGDPDELSALIIEAVWQRVREG